MNFASRPLLAALVCFAGANVAVPTAHAQLPAPAAPGQPLPLDFQALERGKDALNQQKYADAAKAFEELIKAYPQSPAVPEALFRLGYAYYLGGDFDKSVANFQKVPTAKGAPAEIVELATSLTPQVLAAKASKIDPKDPLRDKTLNDALAGFDAFLTKFPKSDEVEAANYGKSLAFFQLQKFEEAAQPLRLNLQKFPTSETIQDSQYTLALILGTEAVTLAQKSTGTPDPAAVSKFDEGEKILRDIITRRLNVALMNDAQFQLGEMLSARASFSEADEKELREGLFKKALDAYRGVITKDQVVAAQKLRIENVKLRRLEALKKQDYPLMKRLDRYLDKEMEKLVGFEGRPDETISAKLKNGQIFFQLNKLDEARVLLTFIEPLAEGDEVKKEVSYYITMSYALQGLMDKAEERYKTFQAAYKGDPIAANLQLVMAAGFLSSKDAKLQKPDKAIEYCKEGLAIYPKGRFASDLLNVQASALIGLKRYDEAQDLLKKFVASNPPKELAADAEFNLAIIFKDTGKVEESVKTFKAIRDKYADSRQAEQAWYWMGELGMGTDPKAAVADLKGFVAKYPSSELLPQALFALARGQAATNQADAALKTFSDLQQKFPKSEVAPFTYFERAKIMNSRQDFDKCLAIMKEFAGAYPDSPSLYQAYDFMAQILGSQSKGAEAIEVYNEYLKKRPDEPSAADALLKLSAMWKAYADAQGPVLAQDEKKKAEWNKGLTNSTAAGEQILEKFPESNPLAQALTNLLEVQKMKLRAHLITDDDVVKYFEELAKKAEGKPAAQSKINFTLAGFLRDKKKGEAKDRMAKSYDPNLKYAPEDIDLFGQSLLESKEYDKAIEVYQKLAKDYPVTGADKKKAPKQIQEAQAIALAGEGNALLGKGENEPAAKKFQELEENYAWSPKMMVVNYGIAKDLHDKKKDDEALTRLLEVVKNSSASSELRAKSMFLIGQIHEEAGRADAAIDNYIKIGTFYASVQDVAAEGLWHGAQLLERQAKGEFAMPTPPPKATPGPKASPKAAGTPAAKPAAAPTPEPKA